MRILHICLLLFLAAAAGRSQPPISPSAGPKHEVRAVWITTLLGLDWPKSLDTAEQKRSLERMVRELSLARYNTIYFQVRGRADAMYRSLFEPWSEQLTGTLGKDPGWDPLEWMIREAHDNGIEVHAWFNTFLVRGAKERRRDAAQLHVVDRHPEWVREVNGEWWLDPGIPAVREYLLQVGLDIARNYDIDGFQFDFIRYPAAPFPDEGSYRRYGAAQEKGDWRRGNVTRLLAAFHDSLRALKPYLKLGATPLGIYRNSGRVRGLQSYDEVYQDSRGWLSKGIIDYLAPQIYWALGDRPANPDFALLAKEWSDHAYGRQIILGIGAYKPEVADELGRIIDVARAAGAAGHAFFRYSNVAGLDAISGRYRLPANVPPMAWKDARPPAPPAGFRLVRLEGGVVRLSWQGFAPAAERDGPVRVNVYRSEGSKVNSEDPAQLLAVATLAAGQFTDSSARGGRFTYAISFLDRGNNESALGLELKTSSPEILALAAKAAARFSLGRASPAPGEHILYVPYEVGASTPVAITIVDERLSRVRSVVDDILDPGRYVAAAEIGSFKKGRYTLVMEAGSYRSERRFELE